ncbi:MAG TPA: hypothetical protein VLQ89_04475 [Candidatus Binatia bacterium]|nr:hypothetical protein [Candidatus Binatia bacterium]
MKYKILMVIILFLAFCLPGEEAVALAPGADPAPATAAVKDGYALLNSLLTLFENLPVTKVKKGEEGENKQMNPGITEVHDRLSQLSLDAKIALNAGRIDKIFHKRYQRMLMIFKLVITPIIRGELLKELFMNAFDEFVWDITGERWRWEDADAIPKMAAAMEEEFVQMQFYLDTRQAREDFKKKIGKRILPPPPPPASAKKKPEVK